jgi:hypothetical protein
LALHVTRTSDVEYVSACFELKYLVHAFTVR